MTYQHLSAFEKVYVSPSRSEPAAWYVVYCQPFKERYAAAALQEHYGIPVYLPEVRRMYRGQVTYAPLFPRYLFANIHLQTHPPSQINASPGVVRLVTLDLQPQPIASTVVQALAQRIDHINEHGGLPEPGFQPGEPVQITAGPLRGLEAVFVGPMKPSARVRVLLEFMGRLNEVELDRTALQSAGPAEEPPAPKRSRRTRGRGRVIA
jgi:transcriptional antiterminator RfaH